MIDRHQAAPLLQPFAVPTLEAFSQAQAVVVRARETVGKDLGLLAPGVGGIYHGVNFWAFFASFLEKAFVGVGERDPTTSDQRHRWLTPGGEVCIQLKSNVEDLCLEQLTIEGFPALEEIQPALIALTWEHLGVDRLHPTFIHIHNGQPVWELPVRELATSNNVASIQPDVPGPVLSLRRQREQVNDTGSS